MHEVWQFLGNNWGKILAAAGTAYVAIATSLPLEKKDFEWYTFMRAVLIAPIPVGRLPQPKPQPPSSESNPKA